MKDAHQSIDPVSSDHVKLVREMPNGTYLFEKNGAFFRLTEEEVASLWDKVEGWMIDKADREAHGHRNFR